jgi:hypothetical protein
MKDKSQDWTKIFKKKTMKFKKHIFSLKNFKNT